MTYDPDVDPARWKAELKAKEQRIKHLEETAKHDKELAKKYVIKYLSLHAVLREVVARPENAKQIVLKHMKEHPN